jgi:hypothetical protein
VTVWAALSALTTITSPPGATLVAANAKSRMASVAPAAGAVAVDDAVAATVLGDEGRRRAGCGRGGGAGLECEGPDGDARSGDAHDR